MRAAGRLMTWTIGFLMGTRNLADWWQVLIGLERSSRSARSSRAPIAGRRQWFCWMAAAVACCRGEAPLTFDASNTRHALLFCACTASCYQMAVTASVAGERYSLVCFCWACSVHVLAPICQTAFVAPRPHERELSGHERSTCAAVHALPAATRWQSQLASLASATHLFASAGRVLCMCWRPSARQLSSLHAHMSES